MYCSIHSKVDPCHQVRQVTRQVSPTTNTGLEYKPISKAKQIYRNKASVCQKLKPIKLPLKKKGNNMQVTMAKNEEKNKIYPQMTK